MLDRLESFGPFIITLTTVVLVLWFFHWLLIKRQADLGNEKLFPRQLAMLGLTLVGLLIIVFALPIEGSSRNQLLGLIGIVISAIFAFSSTTVTSNLLAGLLLRITKPFKVGDFIRIGDHFGRVSERGLFDTEIQTEARELVDLPNSYCISNPVTTIRSTGAIISASLSLGYDLDRRRIEQLLMDAAQGCGLTEPFVHILELGDFSVTYRISGVLEESKRFISARSNLLASVLDTLHSHDIEIMSPTFMNQRRIGEDAKVIPPTSTVTPFEASETSPEDITFDKAERAEQLEAEKRQLLKEIESLEGQIKEALNDEQKQSMQTALETVHARLKALKEMPDDADGV